VDQFSQLTASISRALPAVTTGDAYYCSSLSLSDFTGFALDKFDVGLSFFASSPLLWHSHLAADHESPGPGSRGPYDHLCFELGKWDL
jgi:hypothetical protein